MRSRPWTSEGEHDFCFVPLSVDSNAMSREDVRHNPRGDLHLSDDGCRIIRSRNDGNIIDEGRIGSGEISGGP